MKAANEQVLAAQGFKLADWDAAAQSRNRKRMVELLSKVDLADQADEIADTILADPQRYGF